MHKNVLVFLLFVCLFILSNKGVLVCLAQINGPFFSLISSLSQYFPAESVCNILVITCSHTGLEALAASALTIIIIILEEEF